MTTLIPPEELPAKPARAEVDATAQRARLSIRDLAMPLALLAIATYFHLRSNNFLAPHNLSLLAIEVSITGVLALGMLLVILPGHIDLSAGSGVGLCGGVAAALIIDHGFSAPVALLLAALFALIIWGAMGAIIVLEKVPAFIITLGGLLAFRGLHLLVIHSSTVPVAPGGQPNLFSRLQTEHLSPTAGLILAGVVIGLMAITAILGYRRAAASGEGDGEMVIMTNIVTAQLVLLFVLVCNGDKGVPVPTIILGVVAVAVAVLTKHTPFGRYLYAVGGNEEAALVSGVPVARTAITAFVLMGLIVALTGFMQTAYVGSSTPTVGELMELDAVAACVIGGVSLKGGRGTVFGVLLGALVMATLLNGMQLLSVQLPYRNIARGVVLALAVWADVRLGKR